MNQTFTMREEFVRTRPAATVGVVEKPLGLWDRLYAQGWLRKTVLLLLLALLWEVYARQVDNDLLFPTLGATLKAAADAALSGELTARMMTSLKILLTGYAIGIVLAALLATTAITTRIGTDLLETLTSMFNPLPAIALLPLTLIWFGLGQASIVFVLVHSVLWAVALNTHSGFRSVSSTLRMVGRNYGLTGFSYVAKILIPAAFPSILAGLKIGWAFAWRTLIAAELVFGVSSGSGGLGWFIYESKNQLEIPSVFAGLLIVIAIGFVIENVCFAYLERISVRKWGMQQ
ncbi:MAG: ABC transporter permease [Gammaproteobacteria bacterium]|nr:ABC transporter permease [Gammaproteobacteria bacterium]MBU1443160.1 ABC transporter permease [Gammaproteobacteria bacterium]MBU2285258.1 ABC transporter permease [Gammaproteobacteria bacterium]